MTRAYHIQIFRNTRFPPVTFLERTVIWFGLQAHSLVTQKETNSLGFLCRHSLNRALLRVPIDTLLVSRIVNRFAHYCAHEMPSLRHFRSSLNQINNLRHRPPRKNSAVCDSWIRNGLKLLFWNRNVTFQAFFACMVWSRLCSGILRGAG